MPLPKRAIVPVNVSNIVVPKEIDNELEYVANATLSNLTRQLASLSLLAADLFAELTDHLMEITNRNERLNHRIETLKHTLSETAIKEDDLMIGLISLQSNPYKSRMEADQQVLNKNSMPNAISEIYLQCEPPPALEQLDRFRYDNKQSMKFYTDPTFFFQLWCQEMLQDTKLKKKKKRRIKKQIPTAKRLDSQSGKNNTEPTKIIQNGACPVNDSSVNRLNNVPFNGFELPPPLLPPMECHNVNIPQPQFNYEDVSIYNTIVPPKDVAPMPHHNNARMNQGPDNYECNDLGSMSPPPPVMSYLSHKPGAHPMSSNPIANANMHTNSNDIHTINDTSFCNQSTGQSELKIQELTDNIREARIHSVPPPPAPPPPPSIPPPPSSSSNPMMMIDRSTNNTKQPIYAVNTQSIDLLSAIRSGIQLRKIGDGDNRPVPITEAMSKGEKKLDVQAIFEEVFKRRPYVDNNSDSEEGSDEDEDSSLWSSDNDK